MANIILVVGGDKVALKAAVKARIRNPEAEVKVVIPKGLLPYMDFGVLDFQRLNIEDFEVFKQRAIEYYESEFNIKLLIDHDVVSILLHKKQVVVLHPKSLSQVHMEYDVLILAMGSKKIFPSVEGIGLKKVFIGQGPSKALEILELIQDNKEAQAVIIGGGIKGIEAASALWEHGVLVTVIEESTHLLPEFDIEIGDMVHKHLTEKGVEILTGEKVLTLISNAKGEVVEVHTPDHILPCDLVIWITEDEPNTTLITDTDLVLDETGAIQVNDNKESSLPGVYAVGDCASSEYSHIPFRNTMAGKIFDIYISKAGFSLDEALSRGYQAESVLVAAHSSPLYHPGSYQVIAKLIADRQSRKVIGAQFLGETPVDKPAELIASLVTMGGRVEDLDALNDCTSPMKVILLVGQAMLYKLEGIYQTISPIELYEIQGDKDLIVLDIRTSPEVTMGRIPGAIHIPIAELETRCQELEPEKTIILVGRGDSGMRRGYGILISRGFGQVKILEGGISVYPYKLE